MNITSTPSVGNYSGLSAYNNSPPPNNTSNTSSNTVTATDSSTQPTVFNQILQQNGIDLHNQDTVNKFKEIMRGYDFTSISLNEEKELGGKLCQAGIISGGQLMILLSSMGDLDANFQTHLNQDQRINVLEMVDNQINFMGKSNASTPLVSLFKTIIALNAAAGNGVFKGKSTD